MNTPALLALANALDTVPENEFDMGTWDCGCTACAIGWGNRLHVLPDGLVLPPHPSATWYPAFNGETCGKALAAAYGMTIDEVTETFYACGYECTRMGEKVQPSDVAAKIRELVEAKGK